MAMSPEELEKTVLDLKEKIDGILETASNAEKDFQYKKGLEGFKERNGATLEKYRDTLKKLNGDDFDLDKAAFDEYSNDFSDIEEATYVAQLVSEIDAKLNKLKEALGDDHVMVESDGDETKVETHNEVIETESNEEEKPEEKEPENEEAEKETEESDEEADFMKELEADYEKYKR